MSHDIGYVRQERNVYEFVPVEPAPEAEDLLPEEVRRSIVIDTVHDGDVIPERLFDSPTFRELDDSGQLWDQYVRERDWGANAVAAQVARTLGTGGYYRVSLARVIMDFNRFPGVSPPDANHFDRLAIIEPVASSLDYQAKRYLLENFYDTISDKMESVLQGKLIRLAVHTYDAQNLSKTERPAMSLVTRSLSYQQNSRLPYGLFDPLFPDVLAECSTKHALRDRVALTLQKAGINVENNFPYCLPDGCIEIRSQPWLYFSYLREAFEKKRPDTLEDVSFQLVWQMLLNTNMRRADSEALAGYLHRFRKAPAGRDDEFRAARVAYEEIRAFSEEHPKLLANYRRSPDRTSCLGVEVRKDLLWRMHGDVPATLREDMVEYIGNTLAEGLRTYVRTDREAIVCRIADRIED